VIKKLERELKERKKNLKVLEEIIRKYAKGEISKE
jgi:hypothetical protein